MTQLNKISMPQIARYWYIKGAAARTAGQEIAHKPKSIACSVAGYAWEAGWNGDARTSKELVDAARASRNFSYPHQDR